MWHMSLKLVILGHLDNYVFHYIRRCHPFIVLLGRLYKGGVYHCKRGMMYNIVFWDVLEIQCGVASSIRSIVRCYVKSLLHFCIYWILGHLGPKTCSGQPKFETCSSQPQFETNMKKVAYPMQNHMVNEKNPKDGTTILVNSMYLL